MGISGLDKTVVTARIQGKVTDRQAHLLYEVLSCSSRSALAAGRVSLQATVAMSLPALVDSLSSFVASGQPERKLLERLRDETTVVTSDLKNLFPSSTGLSVLFDHLCQFDELVERGKPGIETVLRELTQDHDSLHQTISGLTRYAWSSKDDLGDEAIERVSHEIAACRAQSEGDYSVLIGNVQNLARHPSQKSYLEELLSPRISRFKVVVAVSGAGYLNGLDAFFTAHQFVSGKEDSAAWGMRTNILKDFTGLHSQRSATVFLQIRIEAPDGQSAGRRIRRRVSEVLDQYVAGHRLTDLRLTEGFAVFDCDKNSAFRDDGNGRGVSVASPLTVDWPIRLRESLRMGHLAAIGDSPMTRIALSWSALEAAGLSVTDLGVLASALTLQTLRHQVNESYMYLSQGFRAKEKVLSSLGESLLERFGRATDQLEKETHPEALASLNQKLIDLELEGKSLSAIFMAHDLGSDEFDEIDTYVDFDERGYPVSINTWADLLQPSVTTPGLMAGRAHNRVRALQKKLDGVHLSRLTVWQQRFRDPAAFEKWCSDQRQRFERALYRIYAARNVVLHTGAIKVRGDVVLADSALAIVDLLHEVLGNWSRVSNEHQMDEKKPREVLCELAQRLECVIQAAHADDISAVNFDHLTSPTSTSTDRLL